MKILHRIRGETGKRCLSFFLAFAMFAGLLPTIIPQAQAIQPGLTEVNYEVDSDGRLHVWGTGIPTRAGSSVGEIRPGGYGVVYFNEASGASGYAWTSVVSSSWTSNAKSSYTFEYRGYVPSTERYSFEYRLIDSTDGVVRTFTYRIPVLNGLIESPVSTIPVIGSNTVIPGDQCITYNIWTGGTNGRPLTDYRIIYSEDGGKTYPYQHIVTKKESQYVSGTVYGLKNGITYYYKLQATNAAGVNVAGPYTITPGSSTPPTKLKAIPGDGSITVTWDLPEDLRGGTIQGFSLYSGGALAPFVTLGADARSYTATGFRNGYYDTIGSIKAITQYGEGAAAAFPHVYVGAPIAPDAPVLTKINASRNVTIKANAPSNNGAIITQYNIYVNGSLKKSIGGASLNTTLDAKNDLGLADNTTYNISVSAMNSRGEGPTSVITAFTTNGPPAKVTDLTATAAQISGQIELKWTTPANNGGPITAVQIIGGPSTITLDASSPNLFTSDMQTPGKSNTYFVTGLKDGTSYSFQVRAVNAYGQGTLSDAKSAMPYRIPDAPGGLKVTRGVRSLTLNWSAAANGGNAVSKYNVYASTKAPKKL